MRIRREVLERDGYRCRSCGRRGLLQVDHILPLHRGGGDAAANLQLLCVRCHVRNPSPMAPYRPPWKALRSGVSSCVRASTHSFRTRPTWHKATSHVA